MLQEYKTGEYVLEKKNPKYWGENHGPDEIKWTWSAEPSVMNMALLSGQVDVINPVPSALRPMVPAFAAAGLTIFAEPPVNRLRKEG
ncbi:ABC transporter substrate-binding protein [Klebsiella aerogenes]|uniref:ABC transporter substrate-binding protein n=1 Tax=Klebsiella aerogenes TaxID=548 RepID=UPI0038782F1F